MQTLHNYRLSCLNGRHFDFAEGRGCDLCSPGAFAPGIRNACYRDSRLQSRLTARATKAHWQAFLHAGRPTLLIALTGFMRDRLVAHGADPHRLVVKANSVEEPGDHATVERAGAIVAGRLSREKGVLELVQSWPVTAPNLTIAGSGPVAEEMQRSAGANVIFTGFVPQPELRGLLRSARVLVLPSLWYEGLPLVALEAFAEGTPVVGFRGGGLSETVRSIDEQCAVPSGDFAGLCAAATRVAERGDWSSLSESCREAYRREFTPQANVAALRSIYADSLRAETARRTHLGVTRPAQQ